jgi:MFS family permease
MTTSSRRLPAEIWALGFVSLLMDISSEMIHAVLPVFLVTVLGASTITVGLIEGIGEATASVAKLFSGWLSDRLGKRKLLTVIGYGIAVISKPLFALAPNPSWVLIARFSDRVGKGIRGAPRDALVADLAPVGMAGAAYGLRQSLDTVGAITGPVLALALLGALGGNFRLVFWIAVVPGLLAVATLLVAVREPDRERVGVPERPVFEIEAVSRLGALFWGVVTIGTLLTLARFSEAFLILRAQNVGLSITLVPVVLVIMNVAYAGSAYPLGSLSDRIDRRAILVVGSTVLIAADLVLAAAVSPWTVALGAALWGLHMGMTQGLLAALVAEAVPTPARGSAFGIFHATTGIATLCASAIAGVLWEAFGPSATFLTGAAFTAIGLLWMAVVILIHGARPGA